MTDLKAKFTDTVVNCLQKYGALIDEYCINFESLSDNILDQTDALKLILENLNYDSISDPGIVQLRPWIHLAKKLQKSRAAHIPEAPMTYARIKLERGTGLVCLSYLLWDINANLVDVRNTKVREEKIARLRADMAQRNFVLSDHIEATLQRMAADSK